MGLDGSLVIMASATRLGGFSMSNLEKMHVRMISMQNTPSWLKGFPISIIAKVHDKMINKQRIPVFTVFSGRGNIQ